MSRGDSGVAPALTWRVDEEVRPEGGKARASALRPREPVQRRVMRPRAEGRPHTWTNTNTREAGKTVSLSAQCAGTGGSYKRTRAGVGAKPTAVAFLLSHQLHYSRGLTHPRRHADATPATYVTPLEPYPRPGLSTEAVHTFTRVNVTCVTPLGEEVAPTS